MSTERDGIEFGPLSDSDFQGISDLITRMDSAEAEQRLRDKSAAYYRWMYQANPAGRAIVHSARHQEKVVSSFAVAPKKVQVEGREMVVGKTMDMFTDPAYQGKGLIKQCTNAVFEEAKAAGIHGWYVTPSPNSYPIFKGKWGYREDLQLVYRSRILDFSRVLPAAVKPALLGRLAGSIVGTATRLLPHSPVRLPDGYEAHELQRFGPEVDALWTKVAGDYRVALVRDSKYLNWRYVDNPDSYRTYGLRLGGELVGLVVLTTTVRRGIDVGEIMDFVCAAADRTTFRLLIRLALDDFRQRGCALAQAWSIQGTRLDRELKRAGLYLHRSGVKFLFSPDFPEQAVYDPDAWLLTQGDGNDS